MRKKDILGNFSNNPDMKFTHSIRKISENPAEYAALITFLPGCKDKIIVEEGRQIQWAGAGYKMLMYLPIDEKWCLSTYYTPDNELLFWYFDISRGNFIDEYGMPCTDDIFLDLAIQPNGKKITLDADELQDALDNGEVTEDDFSNAYAVHNKLVNSKWSDVDFLIQLSNKILLEVSV